MYIEHVKPDDTEAMKLCEASVRKLVVLSREAFLTEVNRQTCSTQHAAK